MAAYDATRPPDEAARAAVLADLQGWAARYPLFDPARFPALALTTVAYLPMAGRADRALAALVSLWIIAFDALVDEGNEATDALGDLATRYGALLAADGSGYPPARSRTGGAPEQLDDALRAIVALLAGYRPPSAVRRWWANACRATIAAIVGQRARGRAGAAPPAYAAALPLLVDSIGVRPYLAVGAIVGREPGLAARLPATIALAGECALAIRLANDLRTWAKDEREGGLSTLCIVRAELARAVPPPTRAAAHDLALATLRARLAASHARCRTALAAPAAGATEAGMVRLVDVVVGIYATHDYDTYREGGG